MRGLPQDRDFAGHDAATWLLLALLATADLAAEIRSPIPVDAASTVTLALTCGALAAAAAFYSRVRAQPRFAAMCVGLLQVLLFSGLGIVLSYLLARNGGALWDSTFSAWDRSLGFDWLAYVRTVDAHPWLSLAMKLAYASLIPQVVVLILTLGFSGDLRRLRELVFAGSFCGVVTIALSPLFPALSSYVHLGLTAANFRTLDPVDGYTQLHDFIALRNGEMSILRLGTMQGIIAFPSYHAGLAAVSLWSFCRCRPRWIACTGAGLALLTIASTPVDGGHYGVDVLAGLVLALISIGVANRAVSWRPAGQALRSLPFRRSREAFAP